MVGQNNEMSVETRINQQFAFSWLLDDCQPLLSPIQMNNFSLSSFPWQVLSTCGVLSLS
jgi:hypothetical protein